MRTIKFRAWNKSTNEMNHFVEITCYIDGSITVYASNKDNSPQGYTDNFELLQYTGLKDKNGKEIYEGDILQFQYGENKVNRLVVYNEENCAFQLQDCKIPEYGFFQLSDWKIMDAIVIGNIYENPELIT